MSGLLVGALCCCVVALYVYACKPLCDGRPAPLRLAADYEEHRGNGNPKRDE